MKILFYYLILINIISFLSYGIDKVKAKYHRWRIPEMFLLNLTLVGGVYGSLVGMRLFHHKTKKGLFKIVNFMGFIIYTILIYYLIVNYGGKV